MVEISVIIPTYKRPILLERAIRSVLNQTFTNFEVLIVNDDVNSEKQVIDIINKLNDSRIKYFQNKRKKGANGARNTGLLNAQGKYLALLDDDDEWLPNKLEVQLTKLKQLDQSVWGAVNCGRFILHRNKWVKVCNNCEGNLKRDTLKQNVSLNAGSSLLIKKSVALKVGLFDEELIRHQELEYLLRFFNEFKIATIQKPLVKIYSHNIPNAIQYEKAKILYLEKVKPIINSLSISEQNNTYAIHYRSISGVFAKEGNLRPALYYLKKSMTFKILNPTKYLKILVYIFKYIINKLKYSV